jgi:hypothetical protein
MFASGVADAPIEVKLRRLTIAVILNGFATLLIGAAVLIF